MIKLLQIGWKDLLVAFRDRAALIMMLLAPFALTLGMGLVTGGFSDESDSGIGNIPVLLVNEDEGELGGFLQEALESEELADLLTVTTTASVVEARERVEADEAAAAVIVPVTFSASVLPNRETGELGEATTIEIYASPTRPIGVSVVEAVVNGFMNRVEAGMIAGAVTMEQLLTGGLIEPMQMAETAVLLDEQLGQGESGAETAVIELNSYVSGTPETDDDFNILSFFAPSMAIFFLMYTVTVGARSILEEQQGGTMARLLTTPTTMTQLLGGKVVGTFLTGLAQVTILIVATTLLFGLRWGNGLGVALLIVGVALAATSWGILFASVAQTVQQVNTIGTTVMLIFGVLGGTFFPASQFNGTLQLLGKITPHAWAMDGFLTLATGGVLADVVLSFLALLLMAAVLFGLATVLLRRRALLGLA